jgi:choline kinase
MKVLIVAAGKGERINVDGERKPKPLYHCFDKYLIEHVIENFKKAGINEFYIVVGFMAEHIKTALGDGSKYGIKISYIHNLEFDTKANGWSVYVSKEFMGEPFILTMSDHIFQPEVIQEFVSFVSGKSNCYLCTDKKIKENTDIDDATKVYEEDGKIVNINKKLDQFNSIDCGVFYLTPKFFNALESAQLKGDFSITGGVKELASNGEFLTHDVKEGKWIDVDTREELIYLKENFKDVF